MASDGATHPPVLGSPCATIDDKLGERNRVSNRVAA